MNPKRARLNKPDGNLPFAVLLVAAVLCCTACSLKADLGQQAQVTAVPANPFLPEFPHFAEVTEARNLASTEYMRVGAEYDPALPYANVTVSGTQLAYLPYYSPELDPSFNGMAYACYSFTIPGYTGEPVITYELDMFPEDYSKFWIGLANWQQQRWEWYACSAAQYLQLDAFAPFLDGADRMVIVVLAYDPQATTSGESIGALSYMRLGTDSAEFYKEVLDDSVMVGELDLTTSVWNHADILYSDVTPGAERLCYYLLTYHWKSVVDTGITSSLSVDHSFGNPIVFYWDEGEGTPKWAAGENSAQPPYLWEFSPLPVLTPDVRGLRFISNYNQAMHLASYYSSSNNELTLAVDSSLNWQIIPVEDAGPAGSRTGIALDNDGRPLLGYYNSAAGDLCFVHIEPPNWVIETVDDGAGADVGQNLQLATNDAGEPYIAYFDATHAQIKLAYRALGTWYVQPVPDADEVAPISGLALDAGGTAHISYASLDDGSLRHAAFNGSGWLLESVDLAPGHQLGLANDIAVNAEGDLIFAYSGYANGNELALLCATRFN